MEGDKLSSEGRINSLIRILLDGAANWDILEYVAEQEKLPDSPWFRETPRKYEAVMRIIRQARQVIAAEGISDRDELLRLHVAQRRSLYARAVEQGDNRTALAILDSQAKLLGLFPKEGAGERAGKGTQYVLNVIETLVVNNPPKELTTAEEIADVIRAPEYQTASGAARLLAE